jgi:hypothetical protein
MTLHDLLLVELSTSADPGKEGVDPVQELEVFFDGEGDSFGVDVPFEPNTEPKPWPFSWCQGLPVGATILMASWRLYQ